MCLLYTGAVYPGRNPDSQLRAGGYRVQAQAQRPTRQHCPQVGQVGHQQAQAHRPTRRHCPQVGQVGHQQAQAHRPTRQHRPQVGQVGHLQAQAQRPSQLHNSLQKLRQQYCI